MSADATGPAPAAGVVLVLVALCLHAPFAAVGPVLFVAQAAVGLVAARPRLVDAAA